MRSRVNISLSKTRDCFYPFTYQKYFSEEISVCLFFGSVNASSLFHSRKLNLFFYFSDQNSVWCVLASTFLYQRLPIRNIFLKKSQFVCEIFDKSIKDAIRDHKKLGFSQWKLLFVCFLIRQCVIIISIWKSPWPRGGGTPSEGCSCLPRVALKEGKND